MTEAEILTQADVWLLAGGIYGSALSCAFLWCGISALVGLFRSISHGGAPSDID